jgi:hypothetical protein
MTIGSHQRCVGKSQVHITPRWVIDRLGLFDLDPCAAWPRPWPCAVRNIPEEQDGLSATWSGSIWLNPPFNRYEVGKWIERLAHHGDGVALLHARTEAGWFRPIWESAWSILFLADRIKFCRPDGSEQPANSGAPVLLAAFGDDCADRIERCGIPGALVTGWALKTSRRLNPAPAPVAHGTEVCKPEEVKP